MGVFSFVLLKGYV